jgi:hypothetical protein
MQSFGRNMLVPVLASALSLSLFHTSSHAQAVGADQAMVMLSKSQAVDIKCKFLSPAEHDELSNLVARAELSLAARASVQIASASLAKGRVLGQASSCSEADRVDLSTVISAAKTAVAQVAVQQPLEPQVAAIQPVEPKVAVTQPMAVPPKAMPQKAAVIAKVKPAVPTPPKPVVLKKPMVAKPAGLAQYALVTQKYFLVRRCGTMNAQSINALYKDVLAIHRSSLQNFGRGPVADAMRRAEVQAKSQTCS